MIAAATGHIRKADPHMARVIDVVGPCEMPLRRGRYAALVRAIVGQQVSTAAARAVHERLRRGAGGHVTARRLDSLSDAELKSFGLSRQKVAYVRDLTGRVLDGSLRLDRMGALADDDVVEALTKVKGVGTWTAEMFLMFVLARPDVLPVGDLGIRHGFKRVYRLRKDPSVVRMQRLSRAWRPYRSVGSWYLWRSLEMDPV
jgi:DNA-3-methyladenine glycosylase II